MFAEMRAALALSAKAESVLTPQEVWAMALRTDTVPGLRSNTVTEGSGAQLMLIESAPNFDALIAASPDRIRAVSV